MTHTGGIWDPGRKKKSIDWWQYTTKGTVKSNQRIIMVSERNVTSWILTDSFARLQHVVFSCSSMCWWKSSLCVLANWSLPLSESLPNYVHSCVGADRSGDRRPGIHGPPFLICSSSQRAVLNFFSEKHWRQQPETPEKGACSRTVHHRNHEVRENRSKKKTELKRYP